MDKNTALNCHPCYNEAAHHNFARMHLAVAPKCNIQCNYCNRKYDCSNESRPGVTSEVLSPREAVDKIAAVLEKIPNLSVIGIAGPGDPLANDTTFETLELVSERYPDLTLCLSSNGLALPDNARKLYDLGVRFVTVTMNATDPEIGSKIYGSVLWNGKKYKGTEAAEILINNQLKGIELCSDLGMFVKVNIVMIPGINDKHIPELVKKVRSLGAYIVNILPLIPVDGTIFEGMRAPTSEERKELMDLCEIDAKMMRHCRQCRADAIGMLDNDRSGEFVKIGSCKAGCGPIEAIPMINPSVNRSETVIAFASSDGTSVDCGFGSSKSFYIYSIKKGGKALLRTEKIDTSYEVAGESHRKHIESVVDKLDDCDIIVVKEIGDMPSKILASRAKKVMISEKDIPSVLCDIENIN